ncbi:MAG: ARMT1-like domain-containing protein [archaeon]
MKGDPKYCIKCQKEQIERAVKLSKLDPLEARRLRLEALAYSEEHVLGVPAHEGTVFHRLIKARAGFNPFEEEKIEGIEAAKEVLQHVEPRIKSLKDAVKAAIAANFIDVVTVRNEKELEKVKEAFNVKLAIDDYNKITKYFKKGKKILYLPDNCGEHLFDLILVKMLAKKGAEVTIAGKEGPMTNDVTASELEAAGFGEYAKVISIGSDCIGTNLEEASREFKYQFENAELIIAKGMGHYECLNDDPHRIVFMLKAKCEPVAQDLGVKKNENVLKFKEKEEK